MKYLVLIILFAFIAGCSKHTPEEIKMKEQWYAKKVSDETDLIVCRDGYVNNAYRGAHGYYVYVPKFVMKDGHISLVECKDEDM